MKAYGAIRNKADERDLPIVRLLQKCGAAAGSTLPEAIDYSAVLGVVLDQGSSSSCVACASTKSIFAFCAARGTPCPELSVLASYALTRGIGMLPGEALVDQGAMPRDFWSAAQTFGVVPETAYAFDEAKVNDQLPLDIFEVGVGAHVDSYYTVFETGQARIQALKQAIHAMLFPIYSQPVDKAYEQIEDASTYGGLTGPVLGLHAQVLCGYGPDYFLVRGSWGRGFGMGGTVRVSSNFIASDECADFMAANSSPRSGA